MTKTKFYKHPAYGTCYGEAMKTPVGRFVWPSLIKPKDAPPPKDGQQQGPARFELSLLLSKTDKKVEAFIKEATEMTDAMLKQFNEGRSADLGKCKLFGKYGDGDAADLEKYPYYKDSWVLCARNQKAVKIVGKKKEVLEAGAVTGGMKGVLVVTPIITAHGISYKLEVVQLTDDDGVRYAGGARDATELLDTCGEEDKKEEVETTVATVTQVTKTPKKGKESAINLL